MGKLVDLKHKFVIQYDQNKHTETQGIAYVKGIAPDAVDLSTISGPFGMLNIVWQKLKGEYESDKWLSLEEFFDNAEVVGKKLVINKPAKLPGDIYSLYRFKDLQLIAQLNGRNMNLNIISDNIYKNTVAEETLKDAFLKVFEGNGTEAEIEHMADELQKKDVLHEQLIATCKYAFHVHDYNTENE